MIPTRYISAGPMAAQARPGAAMAAGQATADIGNALAQVGQMGMEMAGKIRRTEEAGKINAFMTNADESAGAFSIELARRSDTDAWPQEWRDKTAELRQQGKALGLSPEGMAQLDGQFTGWASQRAINFETQAATKALGIAKNQSSQSLEYYAARGDKDGFERTLATGTSAGLYRPDEVDKARMQFDQQAAGLDMQRMVEGNPQGVVDMADEEFLKTMPGATLDMVRRGKDAARAKVKDNAFDSVESAQDEIVSGTITDPRQIDENPRYAGLRPMVREKLKRGLDDFQRNKAFGLMNTPEAQAAVIGKVSSKLSDWEPKSAEDADVQYAEIAGLIGQLPEGAMRTELLRQTKAIRSGAWAESASHTDAAMKSLDAAAKAGRFGAVPQPSEAQDVKRLLAAGFLSSAGKLESLGLSPEAAAKVAAAGDDVKDDPVKKHNAQLAALRALAPYWHLRGTPTASAFDQAAAEAMMNGETSVKFSSPEAEDARVSAQLAIDQKLGEAKMQLNEFIRMNPKATPQEIDGQILNIAGKQSRDDLRAGKFDGKPRRASPQGADDSTASLPVGKNLTEIVKNFEASSGFHEKAYWDYGQWSIGYGTKSKEGETITQAEADSRLSSELGSHRSRVEKAAEKSGLSFSDNELDALTSFDFNTGRIETLLAGGTRSKREIADMMLKYRNAGGERLRGLENRRNAERHLFLYGHGGSDRSTAMNEGEFSEYNVITE